MHILLPEESASTDFHIILPDISFEQPYQNALNRFHLAAGVMVGSFREYRYQFHVLELITPTYACSGNQNKLSCDDVSTTGSLSMKVLGKAGA